MKKRQAYLLTAMLFAALVAEGCVREQMMDIADGEAVRDANAIAFSVHSEIYEETSDDPATKADAVESTDAGNGLIVSLEDEAPATRIAPGSISLDGVHASFSLQEKGMGVFGAHTGLHRYSSMSVSTDFMYNQYVHFNSNNNVWEYTPVKYWPGGDNAPQGEYVSFFAYAPYAFNPGTGTHNEDKCIIDFQAPSELGDPWLIYQLGGNYARYLNQQVDLLYDVKLDRLRESDFNMVRFNFKHALACVGDKIILATSNNLDDELWDMANNSLHSNLKLRIVSVCFNYNLTYKGKLVLNTNTVPDWQIVNSGTPAVRRVLSANIPYDQQYAAVALLGEPEVEDYVYEWNDNGIFVIPLSMGCSPQRAYVTVRYQLVSQPKTDGDDSEVIHDSVVGREVLLSGLQAGRKRDVRIILDDIPLTMEQEIGYTNGGMRILDIAPVTYTGEVQRPSVIVVDDLGHVLEEDVDYMLRYWNNTEVGTGLVIAEGVGEKIGLSAKQIITIEEEEPEEPEVPDPPQLTPAQVLSDPIPIESTKWMNQDMRLLEYEGAASGGIMQYAIGNSTGPTESYSPDPPFANSAGTYYIWYRVKGDENHTDTGNLGPLGPIHLSNT